MPPNGLIADKAFFSCILQQASVEGFIRSRQSPWWKYYERVTPRRTRIALKMLLLYGKLYYPDIYLNSPEEIWNLYENVLQSDLTKENLLEITCRDTVLAANEPLVSDVIAECMALKRFLLSSRSRRRHCFDPFNFGFTRGRYPRSYYETKFEFALAILGLIARPTDTMTTLLDRIEPDLEKHEYYKDNLKVFLQKELLVTAAGREWLCSFFENSYGQLWAALSGIVREGQHLANVLGFSDKLSLPVLSESVHIPKISRSQLKQLEGLSQVEHTRIALGVFFDEESRPVLPVVSSIKDVLRLREDRRIKNYRDKIFEWASALKEGETNLSDMKKEIMDANKAVRTIGTCEKVGTWITLVSLPISVALTLTGLPMGIVTSVASFGLACTSKLLKRNYNWYLFGVQ